VDYLIIGTVTKDLLQDGTFTIGGTVTYAARTALAIGCQVRVITSAAPEFDLDLVLSGCDVMRVPAEDTVTFENVYTPSGRQQYLHAQAESLDLGAVPRVWRKPDIVHLAPLAGDVDPALADAFPGALVGVTPQGWLRAWDEKGRVSYRDWADAEQVLPRVDAVIMSQEDVSGDEATIRRFAASARILVVTMGAAGCRVFANGQERRVPVKPMNEVDPTGAGDIFAAAYLIHFRQVGDPWLAAHYANCVASLSVSRSGWAGTPGPDDIAGIGSLSSLLSSSCGVV
jgi:hypothetical protein